MRIQNNIVTAIELIVLLALIVLDKEEYLWTA